MEDKGKGMKRYGNRRGDAGVAAYDYGPDWIRLQFKRDEKIYRYPVKKIGAKNLEAMKRLADSGSGLTTFVNRHPEVKNGYST